MNGIHDLGGMDGFGPVEPEPSEPVFHADWERRVFALSLAAGPLMPFTIDEFRYMREQIDPIGYLERSYYEHWLSVLERQLLDRIRIDRSHIVGSIDPVNPVYTYKVEQIHAVDGIADGDPINPDLLWRQAW